MFTVKVIKSTRINKSDNREKNSVVFLVSFFFALTIKLKITILYQIQTIKHNICRLIVVFSGLVFIFKSLNSNFSYYNKNILFNLRKYYVT